MESLDCAFITLTYGLTFGPVEFKRMLDTEEVAAKHVRDLHKSGRNALYVACPRVLVDDVEDLIRDEAPTLKTLKTFILRRSQQIAVIPVSGQRVTRTDAFHVVPDADPAHAEHAARMNAQDPGTLPAALRTIDSLRAELAATDEALNVAAAEANTLRAERDNARNILDTIRYNAANKTLTLKHGAIVTRQHKQCDEALEALHRIASETGAPVEPTDPPFVIVGCVLSTFKRALGSEREARQPKSMDTTQPAATHATSDPETHRQAITDYEAKPASITATPCMGVHQPLNQFSVSAEITSDLHPDIIGETVTRAVRNAWASGHDPAVSPFLVILQFE